MPIAARAKLTASSKTTVVGLVVTISVPAKGIPASRPVRLAAEVKPDARSNATSPRVAVPGTSGRIAASA